MTLTFAKREGLIPISLVCKFKTGEWVYCFESFLKAFLYPTLIRQHVSCCI